MISLLPYYLGVDLQLPVPPASDKANLPILHEDQIQDLQCDRLPKIHLQIKHVSPQVQLEVDQEVNTLPFEK